MSNLRKKLIRLAHNNPKLRPHLLPMLTKEAASLKDLDDIGREADDFERVLKQFEGTLGWVLRDKSLVPPVRLAVQVAQQKMKKINKEMHEVRELLMGI